MSLETPTESSPHAPDPSEPSLQISEAELDRVVNFGAYNLAGVWVALAGGAGMLTFVAYGLGPIWAGFLAGAVPTWVLSAVLIACGLGGRG